jgi:hypothetical protein
VWYRAKLWRSTRVGSEEIEWSAVREFTSDAPFFIRDDGGRCAVHPYGAEVTPTDRSEWYGDTRIPEDRHPRRVTPTESLHAIADVQGTGRYRYFEERIYDGDPVLVLGHFTRHAHHDNGDDNDDFEAELASSRTEPPGAPAMTGDQGDEADLWRIEDAAAQKLADRLFEKAAETTNSVVSRGAGKPPFVLTTTPKEMHIELSERGGNAAFGIALVPLALAAWLLWVRFG